MEKNSNNNLRSNLAVVSGLALSLIAWLPSTSAWATYPCKAKATDGSWQVNARNDSLDIVPGTNLEWQTWICNNSVTKLIAWVGEYIRFTVGKETYFVNKASLQKMDEINPNSQSPKDKSVRPSESIALPNNIPSQNTNFTSADHLAHQSESVPESIKSLEDVENMVNRILKPWWFRFYYDYGINWRTKKWFTIKGSKEYTWLVEDIKIVNWNTVEIKTQGDDIFRFTNKWAEQVFWNISYPILFEIDKDKIYDRILNEYGTDKYVILSLCNWYVYCVSSNTSILLRNVVYDKPIIRMKRGDTWNELYFNRDLRFINDREIDYDYKKNEERESNPDKNTIKIVENTSSSPIKIGVMGDGYEIAQYIYDHFGLNRETMLDWSDDEYEHYKNYYYLVIQAPILYPDHEKWRIPVMKLVLLRRARDDNSWNKKYHKRVSGQWHDINLNLVDRYKRDQDNNKY